MWIALIAGLIFGAALAFAGVNRYNTISGMAVMKDWAVLKVMGLAISIGAVLIMIAVEMGLAGFHVKPLLMGGVVWGGLLFGFGMAVLGYCPGTMAISAGQGSLDAVIGILGGLVGSLAFTVAQPLIQPLLGPNFGAESLFSAVGERGWVYPALVLAIGAILMFSVFAVHRAERSTDTRWIAAGIILALLNTVLMLNGVASRPIGASTAYPYVADVITGTTDNDYFRSIAPHGLWELWFLAGSLVAGVLHAMASRSFELRLLHDRWCEYKGDSRPKRAVWAFIGGFVLLFGARMAGGCTSGHILSGGMQLATSSMVFAAFVFFAFLMTGKLFYRK